MSHQPSKSNESWQSKFLNTGTEEGLGDLSMMIGTVSGIIDAETKKAVEAERERIENELNHEIAPHGLSLEDSVWLKRLLNKVFKHVQ